MRRPGDPDVAARVRAARAYAALEQSDVARALDKSVATYKRMEQGTRPVSRAEGTVIAAMCGVPTSFMESGFEALGEREQKLRTTLAAAEGAAAGALMRLLLEEVRRVHGTVVELRSDVLDNAPSPHMVQALATARALLDAASNDGHGRADGVGARA
jgi:transcriptional regulator with XRE-family HTH domain